MDERTQEPADAGTAFTVGMAAERTWLAWWRTAPPAPLGATTVTLFTVGGVVLALVTTVVVLAQI